MQKIILNCTETVGTSIYSPKYTQQHGNACNFKQCLEFPEMHIFQKLDVQRLQRFTLISMLLIILLKASHFNCFHSFGAP